MIPNTKKYGFLIVIILILIAPALIIFVGESCAEEYGLDDMYRLAMERAERIKYNEREVEIARLEKNKAVAGVIPDINAFGNYTRYTRTESFQNAIIQPDNATSYGVRLDQSYSLSGREFKEIAIAGETAKKSSYDYRAFTESYMFSVAEAYYNALKAAKLVDIARANVDRLTRERDAASTRLRVGEVTKTALLRAEAELAGARSDLVKAENSQKYALAFLARVVGIEGEFSIKETSVEDGITGYTFSALKELAFSERAELKSLNLELDIAKRRVGTARGAYWPFLSLEGVYQRTETSPDTIFLIKESIFGGVTLNFTLFEGGLRRAQVRQALAREAEARLLYADLEREISIQVENAYLDYLTQKGIFDSLAARVAYARENFDAVSKQFNYGLANSLDLMDANTLLVTAERQLAEAGYNYYLSILGMKRATGTLLTQVTGAQTN